MADVTKQSYYLRNRKAIITKQSAYNKEKRKNDPIFKLSSYMLSRFWNALDKKGYSKNTKATETVGCSWKELKSHLENQFTDGMSWNNYGEWHVDHKIPLASAKSITEICKLNHYTNLQPLWKEDNLKKGDKII
jgi:hypothetical protein